MQNLSEPLICSYTISTMQHGSKKLQKEEFFKSICHKALSSFSCGSANALRASLDMLGELCHWVSACEGASGVASLGSPGGRPH